jgi:hypothetical protein
MWQVLSRSVDVLGLKGATRTGGIPFRPIHKMMDDELAAAVEEVCERLAALLGFESVALLDLQPGEPSPLGGELVSLAHVCLLFLEQRPPGAQPFFSRNDLVRVHDAFLSSMNVTTIGVARNRRLPAPCPTDAGPQGEIR